jgi:hypothetical protein
LLGEGLAGWEGAEHLGMGRMAGRQPDDVEWKDAYLQPQRSTGSNLSDKGETSKVTLGFPEGEIVINARNKITINVGSSKIELTSDGITIDGTAIKLTGNSANSLELKDQKTTLLGAAEVVITGPAGIKRNCP